MDFAESQAGRRFWSSVGHGRESSWPDSSSKTMIFFLHRPQSFRIINSLYGTYLCKIKIGDSCSSVSVCCKIKIQTNLFGEAKLPLMRFNFNLSNQLMNAKVNFLIVICKCEESSVVTCWKESKGGWHARPRALKHVEENKESKWNKKVWSER